MIAGHEGLGNSIGHQHHQHHAHSVAAAERAGDARHVLRKGRKFLLVGLALIFSYSSVSLLPFPLSTFRRFNLGWLVFKTLVSRSADTLCMSYAY